MDFSIETAQKFYNSTDEFPVNLDDAWQWLGYAEKRNALDTLKSYFEEGFDFSSSNPKSPTGGRPRICYLLTVDCFKQLGMLARTEKGKQVRKYFLECERIAKSVQPVAQPDKLSRILDRPDPWQAFYDKDFCDRAFRWFGASFYWIYIYSQFTPQEACKINRLNPPVNGVRPDKIHQYINKDIKARLTPYIRELVACLDGAPTREDFEIGYARHFGGNDQLRLPKI
jgi:hypothetical protein